MTFRFRNRAEAGRRLAEMLAPRYGGQGGVVVLGLPRGGIPVAAPVARGLGAPLDVLIVRKLGAPGNDELAMGAIASGGVRILNPEVIDSLGIGDGAIETVTARESAELLRREKAYRDHRPPAEVAGRTVIMIDDGIATGATVRAAIAALRQRHPSRVVVATPTISRSAAHAIASTADDLVALLTPDDFRGVGQFYRDFSQTTDDEVRKLLAESDVPPR